MTPLHLALAAALLGQPAPAVVLTDVAASAGIDFVHLTGATGEKHLPETMGAGLAWLDYDGDGWQDLYLVQSGAFPPEAGEEAANELWRNLGNGRFEKVEGAAADLGYGQGAVAADVDGDGAADLYVTNYGGDRLWRNLGDGRFEPLEEPSLGGWSSSAAFGDADGDGDLDLYVTRYLEYRPDHGIFCGDPDTGKPRHCDPSLFLGSPDALLENLGEGRWRETTDDAGIEARGRGLGVLFSDLDGDGAGDLYVANDLTLNLLFAGRGDGTFEDLSLLSGAAVNADGKPEAGMGLALGDVDGDGDPDLAVTNFDVETNTLYENLGEHLFAEVAAPSGFGVPSFNFLAFGVAFDDLDLDGDLDAYVGNGHIFEQPRRENITHEQRDQVLLGDGSGRFEELRTPELDARRNVTRGVAVADFDNDGDGDLGAQENGGAFGLLRNDTAAETAGRWLGVILRGRAPNVDAVGARVTLSTDGGHQVRWVTAGDSYQSSSDRRVRFGIPAGAEALSLTVRWPSGEQQRWLAPPAGRYLLLAQPRSVTDPDS